MSEPYKHKQIVKITLESNNPAKLREIAYKLFTRRLSKKENNPEDIDNYVSISAVME